ncbi:ATP-binding cassette domain-containing protein [Polaromonas sp.]|uniref:phosphatase domain-containing putative toxin n=1 Tax=Polaromonas sp. TaxID=1869339 RepID=UPI003BB5B754
MKPVLVLQGFGVAFGTRTILLDMSLSVSSRGCTVLLGPSGTGKSTLLRSLAGLNDANPSMRTWGKRVYEGAPLSPLHRPALVAQKADFLMATVQDSLITKLPQRSSLTRAQQLGMVRDFLERTGQTVLAAKLATPVIGLPPHERQIIAILRQALSAPALLMVDEPTANLPPDGAQAVLDLLEILATERAVLMVSHHLAQTRQIAQEVVLMADGVVQESAAKDDFFLRPQSAAAQHYLRSGSCPEAGIADQTAGDALAAAHEPARQVSVKPVPPAMADKVQQAASLPPRFAMPAMPHWQPDPAAKSAFCGPRGFVWLIEGKLAGTPLPGIVHDTQQDLHALRNAGITRLISLTETPFDATLAALYGIQCTALPIRDMKAPTSTQAWFLCESIDRSLQRGEVVAVHCKAGFGRTGTALAMYLIWLGGGQVGGAGAMAHVRRLEARMIQSIEQEQFLEKFAELVAHPPTGKQLSSPAFNAKKPS